MGKYIYIAQSAFASLRSKRNRKINLLILFCFTIAFFMPILCFANVNTYIEGFETMKLKDQSSTIVMSANSSQDIQTLTTELEQRGLKNLAFEQKVESIISIGEKVFTNMPIYGITKSFFDYESVTLTAGRNLTDEEFSEGNDVGLIEESFFYRYELEETSLPFILRTNDVDIEIVGAISSMNHYTKLFLPQKTLSHIKFGNHPVTGIVYAQNPLHLPLPDLLEDIGGSLQINEIITADDQYQKKMGSGMGQSAVVLAIGFFALLFSLINIVIILIGKLVAIKKMLAVRQAMGASQGNIMLMILIENLALGIIALSICYLFVGLGVQLSPPMMSFTINWRVYAGSVILLVLTTFLVSRMALSSLMKKSIVEQLIN